MRYKNPSAARLLLKWEWTETPDANRWYDAGNVYELPVYYTPPSNPELDRGLSYTVTTVTRSLEGSGRALTYRIESIDDNELSLIGWAVKTSAEGNP